MRIEEILSEGMVATMESEMFLSDKVEPTLICESFAVAKIRKYIMDNNSGKKASIKVLQSPTQKSHYIVYVNKNNKTYTFELKDKKIQNSADVTPMKASQQITQLELQGWNVVDSRSWVEKYRFLLINSLIGVIAGVTFASFGLVPATAFLLPIVAGFFSVFAGLLGSSISNPLSGGGSDLPPPPSS